MTDGYLWTCDRCGQDFSAVGDRPHVVLECLGPVRVVGEVGDADLCPACENFMRRWWKDGALAQEEPNG